jgi:hypothetical protein
MTLNTDLTDIKLLFATFFIHHMFNEMHGTMINLRELA